MSYDNYEVNLVYEVTPTDFELFPKINEEIKSVYCNLGLWTFYDTYPKAKIEDDSIVH